MVANLVIAGSQHEAIEGQWLWLAVRNVLHDGDELADHATAQEQEVKVLLQRLEDGTPSDPDYQGSLQGFVKAGCEHIAYEQDVVWPRFAAQSATPTWNDSVSSWSAKKAAPTCPHPATPPVGTVQKTVASVQR
jgi:hypothetical protein